MSKPFWRQVSNQLCWKQPKPTVWVAWLQVHIGDIGDSQIKGGNDFPVARLRKTHNSVIGASETYEFEVEIGHPDIRRALQTRLKGCFFEIPEEGKKALEDIVTTIDMSSLTH